ncbi:hypothetical protein EDD31_1776 [Bogoriella caseilytica]|uniref:Uncharacterized protein n=1 Tax=Bogoriella caseilytica TaxID=56055 RepID=A0A3N2BDS4_9MICO|nr:hypothetical protein EDD31_1776 [Bogoriella caseilytica]
MVEGRPRRSRRAIRLSVTDQRRLDAGEISDPTQALHTPEDSHPGETGVSPSADSSAADRADPKPPTRPSAEDERILREVPPHFGPL